MTPDCQVHPLAFMVLVGFTLLWASMVVVAVANVARRQTNAPFVMMFVVLVSQLVFDAGILYGFYRLLF